MITPKVYKQSGLICRSFTTNFSKKQLYISLVQSQLLYYSQVWQPYTYSEYITPWNSSMENIINDYILHLITPDFLNYQCSLLRTFLNWITCFFLFKSFNNPSPHFDVTKWIHLTNNITRSSTHLKIAHKCAKYNLPCLLCFSYLLC